MSRGLLRGVPGCGRMPHGFKLVLLKQRLRLLLLVSLVSACGRIGYDRLSSPDGAVTDAGALDASDLDGGATDGAATQDSSAWALDAASVDGAVLADAGSPDASTSVVDPGVPRIVGHVDGAPFSPSAWAVQYGGDLSDGARFIAFDSALTNLVSGDTNGQPDVFVLDTMTRTIERIDFTPSGLQPNGDSYIGAITPDGRYVTFGTTASRFVPGDTEWNVDVIFADRTARTVETVSVSSAGVRGNGNSNVRFTGAVMSNDARFVVFTSMATNLGGSDFAGGTSENAFVRDRLLGTTTCLSCLENGDGAAQGASDVLISGDGRYAFFASASAELIGPGASGASSAIFRRDLETNELLIVSRGLSGAPTTPTGSWSTSDDGSRVVFQARPVSGGIGWVAFLYDVSSGVTTLASSDEGGDAIHNNSGNKGPSISPDGRYVAFYSGGGTFRDNVFVRDYVTGRVRAAGERPGGIGVDGFYFSFVFDPSSTVALVGTDEPLSDADGNGAGDLYLVALPLE